MNKFKEEKCTVDYSVHFEQLKNQFYFHFLVWVSVSILLIIVLLVALYYVIKRSTKRYIAILIFSTVFFIVFTNRLINYFKDLGIVNKGQFCTVKGTAVSEDTEKNKDTPVRYVRFKIDEGIEFDITLYYGQIYKGDRFEIIYLPNTGHAVIVQKLKSN